MILLLQELQFIILTKTQSQISGKMLKDQQEKGVSHRQPYLANSSAEKGLNSCLLPTHFPLSTQPHTFCLSVSTSTPLCLASG